MRVKFIKILFFVLMSSVTFQKVFPSIVGKGNIYNFKTDQLSVDDQKLVQDSKSYQQFIAKNPDKMKSISLAETPVSFDKTYFYSANYFYLGSNPEILGTTQTKDSAFVRALITNGALSITAMAPKQAYINGTKVDGKLALQDNPIYDSAVTNFSVMNRNILLTIQKSDETVGDFFLGSNKNIYSVSDLENGKTFITNITHIHDAAGANTSGIVKIVGGVSQIFAAVKPNGGDFGSDNSGIAILVSDSGQLSPINAQTGTKSENVAKKIDLAAGVQVAITQEAQFDSLGFMHWDSSLQRLYIGFKNLTKSEFGNPGGGVDILVGRIGSSGELILEPAVSLNSALFTSNSDTYIFGFYSDGTENPVVYVNKIKTMHTNTDKTYLIVNASADQTQNNIYCLPLVSSSSFGDGSVEANVGKIAKKDDITSIVSTVDDMTVNNDVFALVGGGSLPIQDDQLIEDIHVVNSAVFVSVAQDRSAPNNEAGIFVSNAIFDSAGNVRAWTPWQRVMGSIDKVYGFGFDLVGANYWYLTDDQAETPSKDIVKVTQWGSSVDQAGLLGNGLVKLLYEEFPHSIGGVAQIFNFDEQTPSFDLGNFSMMVATGYEKVALIQSGKLINGDVTDAFTPTQDEFQKNINVFIKSDDALKNIGPICASEVSRISEENTGWLFVGGHGGLAVLSKDDGSGWDSSTGLQELSSTDFPGSDDWTFKNLLDNNGSQITQVRKILCEGVSGFTYLMTANKLYRFLMDQNKFTLENPISLGLQEIALPVSNCYLLDMLIINRSSHKNDSDSIKILLATTKGLFVSDEILDNATDLSDLTWNYVSLPGNNKIDFPVAHLSFLPTEKGGRTLDGNLYILASDFSLSLATIYRFNVGVENADWSITPITEPDGTYYYYPIGELRSNLTPFGYLSFHTRGKHLDQSQFLKKINMVSDAKTIRSNEREINLDVTNDAYNIGVLIQDTASGALVAPGDWGIRVSE